MHIQLITSDEHSAMLKVHALLTELASGARLPAYPQDGICFNMSAELGVQRGTKRNEYPQAYHDFGTGLYKLFCHQPIRLHGASAAVAEEDVKSRKSMTSVDFTSFCCRTFKGFELDNDYFYPIPRTYANVGVRPQWDGQNGANRRLLCGHMAEVLGERLAYLDRVYGLRYTSMNEPQREYIQLMRNAVSYLRYNTPTGRSSGVCFKATELASSLGRKLTLKHGADPALPLKHVAYAVLRDALANEKDEGRIQVMLEILNRLQYSDNGVMCKFVGAVAFCKIPVWFADRMHNKVSSIIDYPIPGGQYTYSDPTIDNWEGEQLKYRQQLMDKLLGAIDAYAERG